MKKILLASALVAGGAVALQSVSFGHGGTYRGPGDTVPSGGGGSTGGGPSTPGTGGPSTPGPAGPTTPAPGTPGGPGAAPTGPKGPTTSGGGGDQGPDLTLWQFWWGFNREPYLNLKSHIHSGAVVTGSDEYWLGQGTQAQAKDTLRPSEEVIRGKVVPELLAVLKTERHNDIVTGALVALSKIGPSKDEAGNSAVVDELKKWLADGQQEIAETAAVCFGIYADDKAENVAILTELLENNSNGLRDKKIQILGNVPDRTRAFAAYGLGLIGNRSSNVDVQKQIANTLMKMADGPARTMGTRDVAVACVVAMGLVPTPVDEAALASLTPPDPKKGFAKPTEITSRVDQVAWLMSYYSDEQINFLVRAHVPRAVALLVSDMSSVPWLKETVATRFLEDITKLAKTQNEIKQSCIIALGQIGDCDDSKLDKQIRDGLMETKDLPDQMCKNFALIALGQAAGRPGTEGDPLGGLKERKGVLDFFQTALAKGQSGYKAWAALGIGVMERSLTDNKSPSNLDMRSAVREALKESKTPTEVGAYAIASGIMRDVEAKDALRQKLQTVTEETALGYVAIGIGLIEDVEAKEQITAIIKKSKYKAALLQSAAIGLGLLGDKQIVPELITMLEEADALSSQAAISNALGFIGDTRSIDPLIAMLKDKQKTARARGFAAVALGIVADKEPLPWNAKISIDINYRANTPTLTSPDAGTGILDIL